MTDEELKDLVIVVTEGGSTWIGRVDLEASQFNTNGARAVVVLDDAYVLRVQAIQGPNGQMAMHRSVWPLEAICGHPSLMMDRVWITAATCKPLADLEPSERAEIGRWIEGAEQIRTQGRAAKAGIVLPGSMPRPS